MPNEAMFQEAMNAIAQGQRGRARDLLTRLLRENQSDVQGWLWMSSVVESLSERIFCLEKVLKLEPKNNTAKRGLVLLGARSPDEDLIPMPPIRRKWGAEIQPELKPTSEESKLKKLWGNSLYRSIILVVAAVAVISVVVGSIIGGINSRKKTTPYGYLSTQFSLLPSDTPTIKTTPSSTARISTPAYIGPTPLWMFLQATYTPTPRYVDTPHPVIESYRAGLRAYDRGDISTMLTHMKQASLYDPGAADILYYVGEANRMLGNFDDALDAYNRAIASNPGFAPAYLGRALAYLALSPEADVSKDLEQATEMDPVFFDAYLERAAYNRRRGDLPAAKKDLKEAEKIRPDSPMLYVIRSQVDLASGDNASALQDAQLAHELDFTLLAAYRQLGQAYLAVQDNTQALENLQIYIRYEKKDGLAWALQGQAYYQEGKDYQAALDAFDQALDLDNKQIEAYEYRGLTYLALNEPQKAVNDLVAAQRQNSQSFELNLYLGRAFLAAKRLNDAYRQFTYAEGLADTDSQKAAIYYYRAQALEQAGNILAAKTDWQALLNLPLDDIPSDWIAITKDRLKALASSTSTATSTRAPIRTATPSPKITRTPSPSATPSPTITRTPSPSATPLPTTTGIPSPTATLTLIPRPLSPLVTPSPVWEDH